MAKLPLEDHELPANILRDIARIESILVRHGALRIILYGSLARGDYRPNSDIDIGFEGIPDERYFHAIAECLMETNSRVSLLNLQDIKGYFRERVLKEGRILYERG